MVIADSCVIRRDSLKPQKREKPLPREMLFFGISLPGRGFLSDLPVRCGYDIFLPGERPASEYHNYI